MLKLLGRLSALIGVTFAIGAGAPALAGGRPIVIDFDPNAATEVAFAGCALDGSVCNSVTDLDTAAFHYAGLDKVYVYGNGIVSLGAPLPSTARLEGGAASFGDGTWFAPGLGDGPLAIKKHEAVNRNQWFDWLDSTGHIVFELEFVALAPCTNPFCAAYASYGPYWNPQDDDLSHFGVTFNGPGRGIEAFNEAIPAASQQPFPPCGDPNVTALPAGALVLGLGCSAHYNNNLPYVAPPAVAIPEPATWALLIGGFALTGVALRRRRLLGA